MKFILGTKEYMTQVYDDKGRARAATVIAASPMTVTQVKGVEKDGYDAIQWGSGSRKHISKPLKGHLKDLAPFRYIHETRTEAVADKKVGDTIDLSVFAEGDKVTVSAISKGKGFQGVVKRHGFAGGSRTHGQSHSEREAGSIGGGLRTRVPKGMRMAGRMGGDRITVKNLVVLHVDAEDGKIFISGAVPGRRGTLVEVKGM